jgi:hypothetical protein
MKMNGIMERLTTIAVAIIGVAMLAALVSKNANTSGVIKAAGDAFSGSLGVALGPVTGTGGGVGLYNGFTPQF